MGNLILTASPWSILTWITLLCFHALVVFGLGKVLLFKYVLLFLIEFRKFDVPSILLQELPLRMADFGVLHRNELSGALTGLTRVRRFQQDDAHIFCMPDQIQEEIAGALDFLNTVYSTFGFTYTLKLSTRPESFLGEIETWNKAEKMMEDSLNQSGLKWSLNPAG